MMDFQSWMQSVPSAITQDALWKVEAYRLALYVADLGWEDLAIIGEDKRLTGFPSQLYRALSSIGANIAEGYSRNSHKEKAHFYEYALGSARESRGWYYKVRHVIGEAVAGERYDFLNQIIRLLLRMVPNQRGYIVKEEAAHYFVEENERGE
jgi:four helix bundle protein